MASGSLLQNSSRLGRRQRTAWCLRLGHVFDNSLHEQISVRNRAVLGCLASSGVDKIWLIAGKKTADALVSSDLSWLGAIVANELINQMLLLSRDGDTVAVEPVTTASITANHLASIVIGLTDTILPRLRGTFALVLWGLHGVT